MIRAKVTSETQGSLTATFVTYEDIANAQGRGVEPAAALLKLCRDRGADFVGHRKIHESEIIKCGSSEIDYVAIVSKSEQVAGADVGGTMFYHHIAMFDVNGSLDEDRARWLARSVATWNDSVITEYKPINNISLRAVDVLGVVSVRSRAGEETY